MAIVGNVDISADRYTGSPLQSPNGMHAEVPILAYIVVGALQKRWYGYERLVRKA